MSASDTSEHHQSIPVPEGSTAAIKFHMKWQPKESETFAPYYTIRRSDMDSPFCVNGNFESDGLPSSNQIERFHVIPSMKHHHINVTLSIQNAIKLDEGTYVFSTVLYGLSNYNELEDQFAELRVLVPPGEAKCNISRSEYETHLFEVDCHATSGDGNTDVTCFQNGAKMPYKGDIIVEEIDMRRVFWMQDTGHQVSCCSHNIHDVVTQARCNQFVWPEHPAFTTSHKPRPPEYILQEESFLTTTSSCSSQNYKSKLTLIVISLSLVMLNTFHFPK